MKQEISSPNAPQAIGTYSQAIMVRETVYLSGQLGLDPNTMQLISDQFSDQAHQVFKNLRAVAETAGGNLNNLMKLTIYLMDLNDFAELNQIMAQYFDKPYPARSTVQVAALPRGAKIEIDAMMKLE